MIKAQIKALEAFPPVSERRKHVEGELEKDLAFVESNMEENPKARAHRERMQRMHKDFFAILKWQRKKMLQILDHEPDKIVGDVAQLKADLERAKADAEQKVFQSKFSAQQPAQQAQTAQSLPDDDAHRNLSPAQMSSGCPVPHNGSGALRGGCPVPHVQAMMAAKKAEEISFKKDEGLIHKVYDK